MTFAGVLEADPEKRGRTLLFCTVLEDFVCEGAVDILLLCLVVIFILDIAWRTFTILLLAEAQL